MVNEDDRTIRNSFQKMIHARGLLYLEKIQAAELVGEERGR
jgi:hypothetical protein